MNEQAVSNPSISKLLGTIIEEEARIISAAEEEKEKKRTILIDAIVNSITAVINEHPDKHEAIFRIKDSAITRILDNAHEIELARFPSSTTQKDLHEMIDSIAAEFPKRYFQFFTLYKSDNVSNEVRAKFTEHLLNTALGLEKDPAIAQAFRVKPTSEVHEFYFIHVHYSEKAYQNVDTDVTESTNNIDSASIS